MAALHLTEACNNLIFNSLKRIVSSVKALFVCLFLFSIIKTTHSQINVIQLFQPDQTQKTTPRPLSWSQSRLPTGHTCNHLRMDQRQGLERPHAGRGSARVHR